MKKLFLFALIALLSVPAFSQTPTKPDLTILAKPGANNTILYTNGAGAVTWSTISTIFTAGTGISISGTTITNTAPDQTVALTGGTGLTITGTYPNFTLTPADASATNELQAIAGSGTSDITLSNSGGTIAFAAAGGGSWSRSGNTLTFTQGATSLPTIDYQTYREVKATAGTTVTVSGFTPTVATTEVYLDGVLMENGSGNDYTLSGTTYTFNFTIPVGMKVVVKKVRAI